MIMVTIMMIIMMIIVMTIMMINMTLWIVVNGGNISTGILVAQIFILNNNNGDGVGDHGSYENVEKEHDDEGTS